MTAVSTAMDSTTSDYPDAAGELTPRVGPTEGLRQNTATGLTTDLKEGFFDRLRSLPIARFAPLSGRILADPGAGPGPWARSASRPTKSW